MKKIAFVNPYLSREERYGVKSQAGGQTPPLGLTNLAAMTRDRGYESYILDGSALKLSPEKIGQIIEDEKIDYVGLTAVTISIDNAVAVAREIKNRRPQIPVILGGPHMSGAPEETMSRYREIDVGVIGEGDYTIIDLLRALEHGRNLNSVPGLIVRNNGSSNRTAKRPPIRDMDSLPFPAFDLLPPLDQNYCPPVHTLKRLPGALLVLSRGCPTGECIFCDQSVFGRFFRGYSGDYSFRLMEHLHTKYGIQEIQIRDDNYVASPSRVLRMCERLIDSGYKIPWTSPARIDMVNRKLLKTMWEAGCWQIWYGIESGSQHVLDILKKKIRIDQIRDVVQMTRDVGISPCGYFIIGNPGDNKATMQATIDFALSLPLDEVHFCFLTPYPGSPIYDRVDQFGTFDNDWKKLSCWLPVFVPYGLTKEDLEDYSKKAFRSFYFRPRIILNYLKKIRSWKHLKVYLSGFIALLEWLIRRKANKVKHG